MLSSITYLVNVLSKDFNFMMVVVIMQVAYDVLVYQVHMKRINVVVYLIIVELLVVSDVNCGS